MSPARPILLSALLLAAPPALAKKNKVTHSEPVAPAYVTDAATPGIGSLTHSELSDGVLYVAGTTGIAAIDGAGAVRWSVALPPAAVRNLDVADGIVAYTAFSVADVDPSEGFKKFIMGKLGDNVTFEGATIGAISTDGAALWSVDSDEQTSLSPPGISPSSIGVMRKKTFLTVSRDDGHTLAVHDLNAIGADGKLFGGIYDQATRVQPLVHGDAFYTGMFSHLIKLDLQGNFIDKTWGNGLTPFVDITCGPVYHGGSIVFGSTGDTNVQSAFFGVNEKLKGDFREWSPDEQSGCGAAYVDGEELFLASNFWVVKMNAKHKIVWESVNKKGGLYPSQNRGVRYISATMGVRKSYGDLVVADDSHVYVGADKGGDVITVLDRDTGAYVRTVDLQAPLVAFAPMGDRVAVVTESEVRFLAPGGAQ